MTDRDKMIEALAKAIYCHKGDLPAPWDNVGDGWEGNWSELRMEAQSQAAAVLELMQPKRLVWRARSDDYWAAETVSGMAYITEYRGMKKPFKLGCGALYSQNETPELAQAAAQGHADAAWLASLPLGELLGGD